MIPWEDNFGKISKKQEEFIVGCLLGDGRLECRSSQKTARLRIHHADSQKDYLFWKFQLLKDFGPSYPKRHEYIDNRHGKKVVSWYFHTKTFAILGKFYTLFYREGRKIVPKKLREILTPFALAVWVMDDGCLFKQSLILKYSEFFKKRTGIFTRYF